MKLTYCLSSVVYFSVVVLVIVINGQPTTDDQVDKFDVNEVAQLREELVKALVRIDKMEGQLAASADKISDLEGQLAAMSASKQNASKFKSVNFMFSTLHATM